MRIFSDYKLDYNTSIDHSLKQLQLYFVWNPSFREASVFLLSMDQDFHSLFSLSEKIYHLEAHCPGYEE